MGSKTEISWTDATWNPVTGCTPVSPGCANCYAARYAKRQLGDFKAGRKFSKVLIHPDRLQIPLHWRKPRRIFVCSMGDFFNEQVPSLFQKEIFRTMISAPQHTFQILTKRPYFMERTIREIMNHICGPHWRMPDNIWLGVTCEDQKQADERIPLLLQTPAAVRFVSMEPMLGLIKLTRHHAYCPTHDFDGGFCTGSCPERIYLDWVICGGESGPGARPVHPNWARSLRDQCVAADIPFHFKQWGEWEYRDWRHTSLRKGDAWVWDDGDWRRIYGREMPGNTSHCVAMRRSGKRNTGRILDGREWLEFPREPR